MRPLSLQKFMAQFETGEPPKPIEVPKLPDDGVDYFHST